MSDITLLGKLSENVYLFRDREVFRSQKNLMSQAFRAATTTKEKEDARLCWSYIQRGIMSYDLVSGHFIFSKKLDL
jgi:hypothetical protein